MRTLISTLERWLILTVICVRAERIIKKAVAFISLWGYEGKKRELGEGKRRERGNHI
jgi:hypothetical protein